MRRDWMSGLLDRWIGGWGRNAECVKNHPHPNLLHRKCFYPDDPHPAYGTWTHSLPLVRPSRAFASQTPFAVSQTAQVSHSRGRKTCRMGEGTASVSAGGL